MKDKLMWNFVIIFLNFGFIPILRGDGLGKVIFA